MKKLTQKQKARQLRRQRRRLRRFWGRGPNLSARQYDLHAHLDAERRELYSRQAALPKPDYDRVEFPRGRPELRLLAPKTLKLSESFEEIMAFVEELRKLAFIQRRFTVGGRRRAERLIADLSPIQSMSIDAALIVAAEFDRIRRVRRFKPFIEDRRWMPWLRDAMDQLGFYDVVACSRRLAGDAPQQHEFPMRFVRFVSGEDVDPVAANQLLRDLTAAVGERPEQIALYEGLIEAVGNVREHAYPTPELPPLVPRIGRWWAGGSYDVAQKRLHLSVYDQGLGIPATLPLRPWYAAMIGGVGGLSDAQIIEKALEYGRSSRDEAGRGNGLWRIAKLVEPRTDSHVHIHSGKGSVKVTGSTVRKSALPASFCGTLIHWDIKVETSDSEQ